MLVKISVSCFLVICAVKSVVAEENCDKKDKAMNNTVINANQYCTNKTCIYKCCNEFEIFNYNNKCTPMTKYKKLYHNIKYVDLPIAKSLNGTKVTASNKRFTKDFVFIYNDKFTCAKSRMLRSEHEFHIWENSAVTISLTDNGVEKFDEVQPKYYCVDYRAIFSFKNGIPYDGHLGFVVVTIGSYEADSASLIYSIGMVISCFFLLLVLLVYALLPQLRNLSGKVLMIYFSSLFLTYLVRASLDFALASEQLKTSHCKIFSPVLYFATISKFCWLNVMSYDLFWAFRGSRKCRAIHRQGERVKFMWYCLYAWGVPLLMTIAVVILDNIDYNKIGITLKPPFSTCFAEQKGAFYYIHVPIGIIIGVNTLLFFMTAYNIWLIKREIHQNSSPDSRNTKKDINNYIVHIKLAVMMGISWSMEVMQNFSDTLGQTPWWLVVLNSYHAFIGLVIFFLFVWKKKILIMLCKKYNINNHYINNLQQSYQYSKSGSEPKSRRYTFKSSRNDGS